jgi:hypothetical protein
MTNNQKVESWIFERGFLASNSKFFDTFKKILRFISLLISLPKILFTENFFELEPILEKTSANKCLVCTKQNERKVNIIKNTLEGFYVVDMHIKRRPCKPNFKRIVSIIFQSINNNFYSLALIAEMYDFECNKDLISNFDFFASSDGVTPLARTICHIFNSYKKQTLRIMPQITNARIDGYFDYNFVTESYKGKIGSGWIVVKGLPWVCTSYNEQHEDIIGIIGDPSAMRIFGLEYWMLILAYKIQKNNYKVKIRLHPQSYKFSNYLIKKIYKIDLSIDESDTDFISSCVCLISSYRSTLVDLAFSSGAKVILDKQTDQLSTINSNLEIGFIDLRNSNQKTIDYIGYKINGHNYIPHSDNSFYPSIADVVL